MPKCRKHQRTPPKNSPTDTHIAAEARSLLLKLDVELSQQDLSDNGEMSGCLIMKWQDLIKHRRKATAIGAAEDHRQGSISCRTHLRGEWHPDTMQIRL